MSSSSGPKPPDRLVVMGAGWTLAVVVGLVLWVVLGTERGLTGAATVILLIALLGALVALAAPNSPGALSVAIFLVGIAAVMLLIGGTGILFLPPLVVFAVAAARARSMKKHPHAIP